MMRPSSTTSAPLEVAPDRAELPAPPHAAVAEGYADNHLSHAVDLYQWLRLLVVLGAFLCLCAVCWVLFRVAGALSHTLLLFSLGTLLAYALDPLVELSRRRSGNRRVSRAGGVLTVCSLLFVVLVLAVVALGTQAAIQAQALAADRANIQARTQATLARTDTWLAAHSIHISLQTTLANPPPGVRRFWEHLGQETLDIFERFTRSAVEGIIIALITIYLLIYAPEMKRTVNSSLPARFRAYAEQWEQDANRVLGGFVRGQALLAGTLGVCAAAGCLLLGLRFWLLIGLFVVFASFIPVFGPYIGAVPAVLAAVITPGGHIMTPLVRVILVLLLFVVINEGGSKVLYPRFVGAALGLHEVVVLFVLFAGLEVGHIWGVLFAAPATALAVVTVVQLYRLWQGLPAAALGAGQAARAMEARAQAEGVEK